MGSVDQVRLFLEPRTVAIIGASQSTGRGSFNPVENLKERGFLGETYPVNPTAQAIAGVKAYPDIKSLPAGIDLAIIMVPREMVPIQFLLLTHATGKSAGGIGLPVRRLSDGLFRPGYRAVYPTPERAVRALAALRHYYSILRLLPSARNDI